MLFILYLLQWIVHFIHVRSGALNLWVKLLLIRSRQVIHSIFIIILILAAFDHHFGIPRLSFRVPDLNQGFSNLNLRPASRMLTATRCYGIKFRCVIVFWFLKRAIIESWTIGVWKGTVLTSTRAQKCSRFIDVSFLRYMVACFFIFLFTNDFFEDFSHHLFEVTWSIIVQNH